MKIKINFLIVTLLSLILIFFLDAFKLQFFCAALIASIIFIILSSITKNSVVQYACIILFSLSFALSGLELYYFFNFSNPASSWVMKEGSYTRGFYRLDEKLGYRPPASSVVTAIKTRYFLDNSTPQTIYDVVYSTDEFRHRITPRHPNAKNAVVFLGGSFTFGEGVNDDENFCYKVAELLGSNYQVINLGINGQGAHHVYSILQGDISFLDKYQNIHVFYSAIEDHFRRSAGFALWDKSSPRYMLEDDKLVLRGSFADNFPNNLNNTIFGNILNKSLTYNANVFNLEQLLLPYSSYDKQKALFKALVSESSKVIEEKYPQSVFAVIAWGLTGQIVIDNLPAGIVSYKTEDWFPDYKENFEKYQIADDGHPNPLAHTVVAEEIVKLIHDFEKNKVSK